MPLWAIAATTGTARRIGDIECRAAGWSPDGRYIAIFRRRALEIVLADGTSVRTLPTPTDGEVTWLRWSPDGKVIRFTWSSPRSREANRDKLWEVRPDGAELQALPFGDDDGRADCCGVWTPDGRLFIYQSSYAGATELRIVAEPRAAVTGRRATPVRLTTDLLSFAGPAISSIAPRCTPSAGLFTERLSGSMRTARSSVSSCPGYPAPGFPIRPTGSLSPTSAIQKNTSGYRGLTEARNDSWPAGRSRSMAAFGRLMVGRSRFWAGYAAPNPGFYHPYGGRRSYADL